MATPPSAHAKLNADPARRFSDYLEGMGESLRLTAWMPLTAGRSAETVRARVVTSTGAELDLVVHLEPRSGPLAGIASVSRQFDLLRALESTDVPAPRALWLCEEQEPLGSPFMVTEYVDGSVPNPWRPEDRAFLERERQTGRLAEHFVETLVGIHEFPLEALPPSLRPEGGERRSPVQREIDRWADVLRRSPEFSDDPLLAYAEGWLRHYLPDVEREALVHGDYRVGNLVIRDSSIAAVLDWELAEASDPLFDLGTVCAPPLRSNGLAGGLLEADALVQRYSELSGREVEPRVLAYYRVLATFKICSLWVNASLAFSAGEPDLRSLRAGFSVLETRPMLAQELGLQTPPAAAALGDSPVTRAYEAMRLSLRATVLPALEGDSKAREETLVVAAAMRGMATRSSETARARFGRDVEAFLRDFRRELPGFDSQPEPRGLAAAVRHAFARGVEPDSGSALAERMRQLVCRSAAPDLGWWP